MSYLTDVRACDEGQQWADSQESYQKAWELCERGDWMLWIAVDQRVDIKLLTLVKVGCARLVEHLMTDQRSIDALNVGEKFGLGQATQEELFAAAVVSHQVVDLTYDALHSDEICSDQDKLTAYRTYSMANAAYYAVKNNNLSGGCTMCAIAATAGTEPNCGFVNQNKIIETYKQCADIIRQHISYDDLNIPE